MVLILSTIGLGFWAVLITLGTVLGILQGKPVSAILIDAVFASVFGILTAMGIQTFFHMRDLKRIEVLKESVNHYVRNHLTIAELAIELAKETPSESEQLDIALPAIKSISSKLDALRNEELKVELAKELKLSKGENHVEERQLHEAFSKK